MNFDPHDSVAWRSFGMLDAEEASLFEDAMRRDPGLRRACLEMDRLVAAIAATTAEPVMPQPDQLENLQRRLGLVRGGRKCALWVGASGWAAALALAGVWTWVHFKMPEKPSAAPTVVHASVAPADSESGASGVEIKRLNDEIEILRRSLAEFHERDNVMFQVLPGRALPLVMTMVPPGEKASSRTPLTAVLGDALAATNRHPAVPDQPSEAALAEESEYAVQEVAVVSGPPMAVPIYDAARDAGTLVVSNLPPAGEGNAYHLWVVAQVGGKPVYLGSLPESSALGADSFDFSLGSSMVLPAGFLLTLDAHDAPASPTEENIVLQGPPTPAR
jgi:anti-sigma-K factor RskA